MDPLSTSNDFLKDAENSWIFIVVYELKVFEVLANQALDCREIAEICKVIDPEKLLPFLNVLKAKNFLIQSSDKKFQLENNVEKNLAKILFMIQRSISLARSTNSAVMSSYVLALQKNQPLPAAAAGGDVSDQKREEFQKRIDTESKMRAEEITEELGNTPLLKIADIGCGAGTYSFSLLERHLQAKAFLYDKSNARNYLLSQAESRNCRNRVKFHELFFPMYEMENNFDLILLSNFTHCLTHHENLSLFKFLGSRLSKSGRLIVKDYIIDEKRTAPITALYFDCLMAVFSNGRLYSRSELHSFGIAADLKEEDYRLLKKDEESFLQIFTR